MSTSVTILLENGRRQRVPVKPNTPILVILEEVCKKHKLNSSEFDLKFHARILDVTSTVQFCGIANNVQLELVPALKSRTESPVSVFLQLEDGTRISGSFLPSSTLWEVIDELCGSDLKEKPNPVIIYTRQEVFGDKLKATNLKMLGLTSGTALLRLLHRTVEQLKNQSVSSVYKLTAKPKPPEEDKFVRRKISLKDDSTNNLAENVKIKSEPRTDYETKIKSEPRTDYEANNKTNSKENLQVKSEPRTDEESNTPPVTSKGVEEMEVDDGDDEAKQSESTLKENKLSNTDETRNLPPFNINKVEYIGGRHALIFRSDSARTSKFDDTSDEFFELTIEDAKTLLRDIRRTRSELEEAALETSALKAHKRSQQLERTLALYPNSVIRILFPNRIVLQGIFKSTETIQDVINFIQLFLRNRSLEFYLYTSPPKTIINPEEDLINIGAVPCINLYFGSDQNAGNEILRPELPDKMVPPEVALKVATHFRNVSKIDRKLSEDNFQLPGESTSTAESDKISVKVESSSSDAATTVSLVQKPNTSKSAPSGKVPKWFKRP